MSSRADNVIRYAIYTRQSVDKGDEFSSCKAQFVTCRDCAKETGEEPWLHWISERFDDEGRPDATLDRPALRVGLGVGVGLLWLRGCQHRSVDRQSRPLNLRVRKPTSEQDAWMPTRNSGSQNRVSSVAARATETPRQEGLMNTLDRARVSGYKFFGGSGGCRYGCRPPGGVRP